MNISYQDDSRNKPVDCECIIDVRSNEVCIEYYDKDKNNWLQIYPQFRLYKSEDKKSITLKGNDGRSLTWSQGCILKIDGVPLSSFEDVFNGLLTLIANFNTGGGGELSYFRGDAENDIVMNALADPKAGEYVHRLDTETVWLYDGSSWVDTLIPIELFAQGNVTQTSFLLNTDASVYADGEPGEIDPLGQAGWYFRKDEDGKKINWYFYAPAPIGVDTLADLNTVWSKLVSRKDSQELPFINIYTKRQNDGNDGGSWFRSRLVYTNTTFVTTFGTEYFMYAGTDNGLFPLLPRIPLTLDAISTIEPVGGTQPDEEILTISFSTNSAATIDSIIFLAKELGYDTNVIHQFILHAVQPNVPNGVHETFDLKLAQDINQNLNAGEFYGSREIVPVGKYDKFAFYLFGTNAGVGESGEVRFAIYDSTFDKIVEVTKTIDNTTTFPAIIDIDLPIDLVLESPRLLYFVLGYNDKVGVFNVQAPRIDMNGTPSTAVTFIINQAAGALPANISASRVVSDRAFYSAIFKL